MAVTVASGRGFTAAGGKGFFRLLALGFKVEVFVHLGTDGIARVAVHVRVVGGIVPTAGVSASALVRVAAVEIA